MQSRARDLNLSKEFLSMAAFTPCVSVFNISHVRKHPVIQYKSKRWPETVLEFCFKEKSPRNQNIILLSCLKLSREARVGGVKLQVTHNLQEGEANGKGGGVIPQWNFPHSIKSN